MWKKCDVEEKGCYLFTWENTGFILAHAESNLEVLLSKLVLLSKGYTVYVLLAEPNRVKALTGPGCEF